MITRSWRDRDIYLALAGLAAAVLIQATILTRVRFFGAQPDLLLVVVICLSLLHGVSEGLLWAFIGGLALDVIAGLPLGISPLALMPVCFLASIGRSSVYVNNLWLPVVVVAIATPIHGWIMLFIRQAQGVSIDWPGMTLRVILPALALNIVLTIVVVRVLRWASGSARLAPVV
jgi:rod shape-determining protein MreD